MSFRPINCMRKQLKESSKYHFCLPQRKEIHTGLEQTLERLNYDRIYIFGGAIPKHQTTSDLEISPTCAIL